jgi:transposase
MLYAKTTPQELESVEQAMKHNKNITEYQRLHIIQLSSKGKTVPELAELFNRCQATIRDYIKRYNQGGLKQLKGQTSTGAPVQIPFNQEPYCIKVLVNLNA